MRRRRGASAVEAAFALPVLFVILFAIVDWSWYLYQWHGATTAMHHGIRLSAGTAEGADTQAQEMICAELETLHLHCSDGDLKTELTSDASGQIVRATLRMPFHAPIGLAGTPEAFSASATTSWYGSLAP